MTANELTQIIKDSGLLPYQIAEAVYASLKDIVVDSCEYTSLEHLEGDSDILAFYLAAKHLKE